MTIGICLISNQIFSYNFLVFTEGDRTDRTAEPQEEDEEGKKEEDDWKPYIPETPNAALFVVYTSPDTFWLSMVSLINHSLSSKYPHLG